MEYVYAAMLLHSAGKEITEENLVKVLKAPGIKADQARAKALVAALEDIDIEEAISQAAAVPTAAPAAGAAPAEPTPAEAAAGEKKEKKEEEEEEASEEEAMAGLGALFG